MFDPQYQPSSQLAAVAPWVTAYAVHASIALIEVDVPSGLQS
jgi:hypothetical protein